jgi:hypothetical protein
MVGRYIKTVEEHLRNVVASHQREWDERLPLVLLVYRPSTHDPTGLAPVSLVFGRELRLPCDLLFGARPDKERPTTDHAAHIDQYARQHLNLDSDGMKNRYDKLAKSAVYHEGYRVWLYRPPHEREIAQALILVGRPMQGSHPDK